MTLENTMNTNILTPFILNFVENIDKRLHKQAIIDSKNLKESYDPQTQMSNIPLYAGTALTYRDTGIFGGDSEQCDT